MGDAVLEPGGAVARKMRNTGPFNSTLLRNSPSTVP